MRILLIVEAFRSLGGIEEVVDHLALEFERVGHEVAILSTPQFQPGCERVAEAPAECFYVNIPKHKPASWRHPERLVRRPRSTGELVNAILQWHPDVVNSHVRDWDKIATIAVTCRAARVPWVQSLYEAAQRGGRGRLGEKALRHLRYAQALTAVSVATRRYFAEIEPIANTARAILGGVDCEAAAAAPPLSRERPFIFSAGRLDLRHKAFDSVVAAFRLLAEQHPQLDLLISGDGPDRQRLEELIAASSLGNRVVLLGSRPRSELWSFYKRALLFAMPSRLAEGLGLVFLEAMASGTPVIGSNTGGTPEIIDPGENGFLVDSDDPAELAGAMRTLLENAEARERMGCRGLDIAARYSWSRVAVKFLEVLGSAAASVAEGVING